MVSFKRCRETKHFSGPIVEAVSDFVEVFLGVDAQLDPLGQILADEAIGVFVGRALPWAVRVAYDNEYIPRSPDMTKIFM